MSKASDRAYQQVKALIVSGHFGPGAQLKEEEIAELCGVSRTPVREAIRRLEAEMFIERTDSQRSFVTDWSAGDVEELFTLRAMMESYAAERATQNMTSEILSLLRHNCDEMETAMTGEEPDIDRFVNSNVLFHRTILDAAASERLSGLIGRLVLMPVVHRTVRRYDINGMARSLQEHRDLIDAFEQGDARLAAAVMTAHIRRAWHINRQHG